MILSLLILSSLGVVWVIGEASFRGLEWFSHYRRTTRARGYLGRWEWISPPPVLAAILGKGTRLFGCLNQAQIYENYLSRLVRRSNLPGLHSGRIIGAQLGLGVLAGFVFGILSGSPALALSGLAGGLSFPLVWLRDRALLRERKLLRELPTSLETLALCSEAGLSLEQGLEHILQNSSSGPLGEEFAVLLEQARSGAGRKSALQDLSRRLELADFSIFSTSLIQADRFGTGIAQTLRQLALTLRDKESQRTEKAVQEMPVKMLFPLILFILPVTFLVIFGPVLLQFLKP